MSKKTIYHPMLGDLTLEIGHADRLLALSVRTKSGWSEKPKRKGVERSTPVPSLNSQDEQEQPVNGQPNTGADSQAVEGDNDTEGD